MKNLLSSLEFAPNGYLILVSDGIDKKLQNKTSELKQNIIKNSTNHKVKPCFRWYLGIILYSEHLFKSKNLIEQKLLHVIWTTKWNVGRKCLMENPEK